MLQVSEKYEKQIRADNRSLRLKVECLYSLQGEVIHTLHGDDCIISMELEEMVNSEDVITMGSACCGKLTLKLIQAPSGLDYDHMILRAFSGHWMMVRSNMYRWVSFIPAKSRATAAAAA